jgi:hypothetical protein
MGQDKWVRGKPGSVSGTVMPPPASDDTVTPTPSGPAVLPSLPKRHPEGRSLAETRPAQIKSAEPSQLPRRRPGEHRPGPRAADRDHAGMSARRSPAEPPSLPDNVRSLFKPVLIMPASEQPADGDHPAGSKPTGLAGGGHGDLRPVPRAAPAAADDQTDSRRKPGRQLTWLVALTVVVLLTAAGTAVALVQLRASSARPSAGTGAAGPGSAGQVGLSEAATIRAEAAAWIAREISRNSIIACDSLMCADLSRAGVPSLNLLEIRPSTPDPLAADVVAATPVLRHQFGGRLSGEYAPLVLASFGTGATRIDVRAVAADGSAAYRSVLRQNLAARKVSGTRLLANSQITLSASARADLMAGRVDPRLLLTLPVLADQHPIVVLGFYDQAPGAGPDVPLTGAELSASDSRATGLSPAAYHRWLVNLLRSQRPPYGGGSVRTTVRSGLPIVSIWFSRPSPLGLFHV